MKARCPFCDHGWDGKPKGCCYCDHTGYVEEEIDQSKNKTMRIAHINSTSGTTYLMKVDDNNLVVDVVPNLRTPSAMPNVIMAGSTEDGMTPIIEFGKVNMAKFQKKLKEKLIGKTLQDAIQKLPERHAFEVDHLFINEDFIRIEAYNNDNPL